MAIDLSGDSLPLVDRVAKLLSQADSVLFITGAGMSADSGLPTYRGVGGLYADEATEEGIAIEDALSGTMLARRPEITWKYLLQIAHACEGALPNVGHQVLAQFEKVLPRCVILTQNVDGFHTQAGSTNVIEIHGNMHRILCTSCDWHRDKPVLVSDLGFPPHCPECNGLLRPDVVLFGEMLKRENIERLEREFAAGFDLIFSIGTSSIFPYITQPIMMAPMYGARTVEINPGVTEVSSLVDIRIPEKAAVALTEIWNRFIPKNSPST